MHNSYEATILESINASNRLAMVRPLNLGGLVGSGGGIGSPPGGVIGKLKQTDIVFDLSELAISGIPASGMSLLDNLNRIRYDIGVISSGSGGTTVLSSGVVVGSGISELDFSTGMGVTISGYRATIVSSGGGGGAGGHTIQDEGIDLTARTNLNFIGDGVTVSDNAGTDSTDVTINGKYRQFTWNNSPLGGWEFVSVDDEPVLNLENLE